MSKEFIPHPPTEQELALYHNLFPNIPVHIQDTSDQTQMLPASALPTDEPAYPPHQNAHPDHIDQDMLLAETHHAYTHPPTGSEPDHQPPLQQGAPGQDESKALVSVPNSTPPSTEPRNKEVVIDIGSNSESDESDEVRVLESFIPVDLAVPYPLPVSCVDQYGRHLLYSRGETTDDDVLPSPPPPPPQQSLEQQLALAMKEIYYWSKIVNRGIKGEPEKPDWLPEDWEMKCVTRTNGSSAGNKYKYYIEPGVKRRHFRSKREVLEFLETGKRRQYKRKAKSTASAMPSNVNRPVEETSSSSSQNMRIASHLEASTSRENEETPNLDLDTVPEKQNEETSPNVDSDQNPPKRSRGSSS